MSSDPDLDLIADSRRFQLGRPRDITPLGRRVLFLRTRSGVDPVACLWSLDRATATEELLVDPSHLIDDPTGGVSPAERSRRERRRESADGLVEYSTDTAGDRVVFSLAGRLFVLTVATREVRELAIDGPALDPQFAPTGTHIAVVTPSGLHVVALDGTPMVTLANPEPAIRYGVADFVAAEEMNRHRGHWWSPDGTRLLVARVDDNAVDTWWRSESDDPAQAPVAQRYAAAGRANADVELHYLDLDGVTTPVRWDRDRLPYVVDVSWQPGRPPLLTLMTRAQTELETVTIGVDGTTSLVHRESDPAWVYLVPGTPRWLPDGRLLHARSVDDVVRLFADEQPLTPPDLQVNAVVHAGERVLFTATTEPTEQHVYAWAPGAVDALSHGPGVHSCVGDDEVAVLTSETLDGLATTLVASAGDEALALRSVETPPRRWPQVELLTLGARELRTAVLFPRPEVRPPGPLPVLMDPYGGPLSQRVRAMWRLFHEPQWWADQGFAVVVADGRGSPNRGSAWEREFHLDLATPPLDDQVAALEQVAQRWPGELDLDRVAMRGWSFGGYLSAMAVLRRPDIFAAGIAGAPVTDWRRYDTVATERYLGLPAWQAKAYEHADILAQAHTLQRPLLLVHGSADDNVHPWHSIAFARRLTAAGIVPRLVTLANATHLLRQPDDIATLLRVQLSFLREALRLVPADELRKAT